MAQKTELELLIAPTGEVQITGAAGDGSRLLPELRDLVAALGRTVSGDPAAEVGRLKSAAAPIEIRKKH